MISDSSFSKWYAYGIALMIVMIAIGGITRLTDSGLSMVDWEPVAGILPPITNNHWEEEFNHYKQYPEYKEINLDMTLAEFKIIFFWEYLHRMVGRIIGLFFIIPLVYMLFKKRISKNDLKVVLTIILLIISQGLLGWYMVMSGLSQNPFVDHIRLMLHFMMAMILVSYTYLQYLKKCNLNSKKLLMSHKSTLLFFIIVLIQIIFGTFTAGLKAGYIFNTYPLMNNSFFPYEILYNSSLGVFNSLINNLPTVQYIHRTIGLIILLWAIYMFSQAYKEKDEYLDELRLSFLIIIQFLLGVLTLLTSVNIYIALLHQVNATFIIILFIKLIYFKKSNSK
ncbi:MAG: hypothetical protein CBD21_03235 [bacterium TMED161]|nr:MAG: hypothetical protein CBD21_03235 [bacterium TMED161]